MRPLPSVRYYKVVAIIDLLDAWTTLLYRPAIISSAANLVEMSNELLSSPYFKRMDLKRFLFEYRGTTWTVNTHPFSGEEEVDKQIPRVQKEIAAWFRKKSRAVHPGKLEASIIVIRINLQGVTISHADAKNAFPASN